MKRSKLFQLLKKLDKNEFHQLDLYVHSPFLNKNRAATILFDFIKNEYPTFESEKLTKEKVARLIYPDETFNAKKIANVMSQMYGIVLDFLGEMEFQRNDFLKKKITYQALNKKALVSDSQKRLKLLEQDLEKQPFRDSFYFENKTFLSYENASNYPHDILLHFKKYLNYLEKCFIINKLKISVSIINQHKIKKSQIEEDLISEDNHRTISKLEAEGIESVKLYRLAIDLLTQNKEQYFYELKNMLFKKYSILEIKESAFLVSILSNYLIWKVLTDSSNLTYNKLSFEIQRFAFEKEILSIEDSNTKNIFQNIIINGCKIGEFNWVEKFLGLVNKSNNSGYSDEVVLFARTNFHFYKKEFSTARELIMNYRFKTAPNKIRAKTILIKIIFEGYLIDDTQYVVLISTIDAFRKYLKRNKEIPTHRISPFLNFLKLTKELVQYKFYRKKETGKLTKIKAKIDELQPSNSSWLIKKANDFSI